jgi:TPR repeat protein
MKKGGEQVCGSANCAAIIPAADAKTCARCKLVSYCGRSCQKADWKTHKPRCNAEVQACDARKQRDDAGVAQSGPSMGGGGTSDDAGKKEDEVKAAEEKEEDCAICLEVLVDPISPCTEQPSHRYCRTCVQEMQRQKLPSCPLCRGKMQDAEELFYKAMQLNIRATKAQTPAHQNARYAKIYDMLHRVLRVDPSFEEAQYNLGLMYYKGQGVQQDFKEAVSWYRKGAEQGDAKAQHALGCMYATGQGVQKESKQAALWFQKAADQGDTMAHLGLGDLSDMAGDYQSAFASYRAGQAADRDGARARMRWCLEKMAESRKKDQGTAVHATK